MLVAAAILATMNLKRVPTPDLLLGDRKLTYSRLKAVTKPYGAIGTKNLDGFYRLTLAPTANRSVAISKLRRAGVDYVLAGSSAQVDTQSAPSVRAHITYLHAMDSLREDRNERDRDHDRGSKAEGEEKEGSGEFFESLEWFLRFRVGPNGQIDKKQYMDAAAHRDQMPPSTWTKQGSYAPGANFVNIGPKNVSTPYTQYMSTGPVSGRKNGIAYAASNTNIYYVATAGGGVWKTTNGGTTFVPLSDKWPFLNTTGIAVSPTNYNVCYVGTGDYYGNFSKNSFGLMRTADGGSTWTNSGDSGMRDGVISRIIVDPTTNTHLVCSVGKSGANNSQLHYSNDSGATWTPSNSPGGDWDDLDISTGGVYYAAGSYPNSTGGIYRSTDKGVTWTAVTNPCVNPQPALEIACSKVSATTLYLLATGDEKIYKSVDSGASWTEITGNFPNGYAGNPTYNWSQASYDYHISCGMDGAVDLLFVGLITVAMSRGGNTSWVDIGRAYESALPNSVHSDQHSFAMNPSNPRQVLFGGDGGLFRFTQNAGLTTGTWVPLNTQFSDFLVYEMGVSPAGDAYIQGGCQDNFTPSARANYGAWTGLPAGDGCWTGFASTGQNFATGQFGGCYLFANLTTTAYTSIKPNTTAFETGFFAPFVYAEVSPRVYAGAGTLWRYNNNSTWTNFGVDITPFAPAQGEPTNVVTELECSKTDKSVVYSGSSYGEVFLIKANGTTYKQIDNANIDRSIGAIDTAWNNPYDVIVGLMGASNGNPRLWRCTNTQATTPVWTAVAGTGASGLPDVPINGIERDPFDLNRWYVATDVGCFMTTSAGAVWTNMSAIGLPNVLSQAIYVNPSKTNLFVATFGRGIWKIPLVTTPNVFTASGKVTTAAAVGVPNVTMKLFKWKTSTVTVNTAPNAAIPDMDPNGVTCPLNMVANAKISNLNAYVKITHQIPNDLTIYLVHPSGVYTKLWSSDLPVAPDLTRNFQTGFFNGLSSVGQWKLVVVDNGPLVTGVVNNFNLTIQYDGYVQQTTTLTSATGTYSFPGLEAGQYDIIPVLTGKTFTPGAKVFNLGPSLANIDFIRN